MTIPSLFGYGVSAKRDLKTSELDRQQLQTKTLVSTSEAKVAKDQGKLLTLLRERGCSGFSSE